MRSPPETPANPRARRAWTAVTVLLLVLVAGLAAWRSAHNPPRSSAVAGFGPDWQCERLPESTGAVMCDRYPRPAPAVGPTAVRAAPPPAEPTAAP